MGPPVPTSQAARKVHNGIEYLYGFPNSEQVFVLNLNAKTRMFARLNAWGDLSRAEFREYISIYPRLYQVARTSRDRIQKWLDVGNNRANFESWGPAFRAFLRTQEEDQRTNTQVRKPGIPPQARWLSEEHQKRAVVFDKRMGRHVEEEEYDDGEEGEMVGDEEEEEEVKYRPGNVQNDSEDVEEARSHVNGSQRSQKRKCDDQSMSTLVGTPFPDAIARHYQLAELSQQQFALRELRTAATGFRTLHSEVLRVAQKLDPGDVLRPLLSHIANSATLDVVAAEKAVRISSELMDNVANTQAEEAANGGDEDRIKRARSRAAYEMLPSVASTNHFPQRRQARHPNLTRQNSQVPEADDNVRSLTVPRERSQSSGYELPDHLAEGYRPLFERSSSLHYEPLSRHAGEGSSRPNTSSTGGQTGRPYSHGALAPAPRAGPSYHGYPMAMEEFRPNHHQPRPQWAPPPPTHPHHMPLSSVEEEPGYQPNHHSHQYLPPSRPFSPSPRTFEEASLRPEPAPFTQQPPPPRFSPPDFGPANRGRVTRATSAALQDRQTGQEPPPPAAATTTTTTSSTRQTRQSSRQPTPSVSATHAPLVGAKTGQAKRGRDKGKGKMKGRVVEVEDEAGEEAEEGEQGAD
ncbi:hypothetical protein QBC41DRAFT_367866 [Cercophora samala]|uniref:Uncharacterized protein n=1 Tax=Cercophora samala TaxID=330535 RepID=A0AA39Z5C9_9PEZI|nr:hypothetical protein QBC41DRAFT_367866 [Cercophora samala]